MEDEEIEILSFEDDEKDINIDKDQIMKDAFKKEVVGDEMPKKNRKKKVRLKKGILQTMFCLLSLLFIIGCIIFYGSRLIKYYKIYNPKSEYGEKMELLSQGIVRNNAIVYEGEGLYRENGVYTYKGEKTNNYIRFGNMTWRIIRTNTDGSIEIILDDYINILSFDFNHNDYINSDIHKYLNDVFVREIDTELLVKTTVCTDNLDDINKYKCDTRNTDYFVKLLQANDFLNSVVDDNTFISKDNDLIWLGNSNKKTAWHSNGSSISSSEKDATYYIKPVVTIKNSVPLLGGKGTKKDPFIIENETKELKLGSYVTVEDDTWIVFETNKNSVKLVSSELYKKGSKTYRFDLKELEYNQKNKSSLAMYLNTTFYNSLDYKDILLDMDVYTDVYNKSYKDVRNSKTTVKVGIPSAIDLKFNNEEDGYYLSSGSKREDMVYYYKNDLISSKPTISRVIRPTISIDKKHKITKGNGTIDNPFILEV